MPKLITSLIVAVLLATLSLGWLLDYVYEQLSPEDTSVNSDLVAITELGTKMAHTLDSIQNKQDFIIAWNQGSSYRMELMTQEDILLPPSLSQQLQDTQRLTLQSKEQLQQYFVLPQNQEVLTLYSPLPNRESTSSLRLWLTLSFYLVLASLLMIWVWPLAKRLFELRRSAKAFGEGDLRKRVTVGSGVYIKDLEQEFNHMAQRIEGLIEDVKLLSGAVSHDLRTPIARLQFGLDALSESEDEEERAFFHQKLNQDLKEMTSLVEALLRYARLEQNSVELKFSAVPLKPFVDKTVTKFNSDKVSVDFVCANEDAVLQADPFYLEMLLNNLMQNASRFAASNIRVNVIKTEKNLVMTVADDGPGIPEDQTTTILKPFVKGKAGTKTGHGLGLAIVHKIVQWHHASLDISRDTDLCGAKFSVAFPKKSHQR